MKNLTYKISLLILGLFAVVFSAEAQEVRGVVSDVNGEPLIGVSVFVDGTTVGVSTGVDGDYVINVPSAKGKTLVFSMIGMATKEVMIGNSMTINVVLEEDANFLDETVVIGYATVKRRDLMGSVTSVGNEALTQVPVASVGEALAGKMAGVQVTATEGDPDAEIKIRVRGGGSITQDASPLYIVDGFPVDNYNDVPASDIQSIDVLKDAFSTAIYGSRGANGVVLITTKSGAAGKISVSYNAYWGQKKMANADAIETGSPYDFVRNQYELSVLRDELEDNYIPTFGVFEDMDLYKDVAKNDWVKKVFGNVGTTFNQNISVSGSGDKVKWTASYAHVGDKAIMVGSDYKRDNLNFKTQYKPIKQITVDINARYSRTEVLGAGANSLNDGGSTSSNGRLKHAVQYTPFPITGVATDSDLAEDYGDNAPPLKSVADNDNRRIRKSWTVNGAVTWHIIDNLNLKVEGGIDDYSQEDNRFYGLTTYYVGNTATLKGQPATQYKNAFRTKYRTTNTLNYNFKEVFANDSHKLDLLVGQEYILTKSNTLSSTIEGFPEFFDSQMAWNFMASGTPVASNNFYNPNGQLLSFFGRANYEFGGRYALSATVRADGSSKFEKGNQWGVFPSAAASWTISNEPWMENASTWLDNLKLRYSYGTAGNNNIPSNVSSLLFQANNTQWISMGNTWWGTTTVGGKSIMPNPDLTWETTVSHNIGLDFSFLRSRINGSLEVYHNTTNDLLIQFPVAGSGYDYQYRNLGSVQNRGFEASLNFVLVEKKNFGLTLGGNISINENKVTSLGGLEKIEATSEWASTEIGPDYIVTVGRPLGDMYGYVYDGVYQTSDFMQTPDGNLILKEGVVDMSPRGIEPAPGVIKYKDVTGDGKITTEDRTSIGNGYPLCYGGIANKFSFYGIDLNIMFQYSIGNDVYNATRMYCTMSNVVRGNTLAEVADRWKPDNASTKVHSIRGYVKYDVNSRFIEDGSYLRLSDLSLGYNVPLGKKSKILHGLNISVAAGNLVVWTKYSGYSPFSNSFGSNVKRMGVDLNSAPYPKSVSLDLKFTF